MLNWTVMRSFYQNNSWLCYVVCSLFMGLSGCDVRKTCDITYANHTGRWITGTVLMNDYVRDDFDRSPYTNFNVTMHPRHSSGRRYEINAKDVFTGEEIKMSGTTPRLPFGYARPNLIIELLDKDKVDVRWVDDVVPYGEMNRTKKAKFATLKIIPVVGKRDLASGEIIIELRQRPVRFCSLIGRRAMQADWGRPDLYAFSEMVDPRRSPEMVIFFEAEDEQGEVVTWRDVVDCRQVVGAPEEGAMFWIEIGREGEYRLGWGQSNERDLRQLRRLLDENALMEPQQWWNGRAKQHPKLPVYSLHSRQTYDFPDLRFDDEIQQQMQQAGR